MSDTSTPAGLARELTDLAHTIRLIRDPAYHGILAKYITPLNQAATALKALAAENERLREAITDYLAGDYERPVGTPYSKDGKPHKGDKCPHGLFTWETCENCIDAHFKAALAPQAAIETRKAPSRG